MDSSSVRFVTGRESSPGQMALTTRANGNITSARDMARCGIQMVPVMKVSGITAPVMESVTMKCLKDIFTKESLITTR